MNYALSYAYAYVCVCVYFRCFNIYMWNSCQYCSYQLTSFQPNNVQIRYHYSSSLDPSRFSIPSISSLIRNDLLAEADSDSQEN